jgi:hypothetical protein
MATKISNDVTSKVARLVLGAKNTIPVMIAFGSDRRPAWKLALWINGKMHPRHIVVGDGWLDSSMK